MKKQPTNILEEANRIIHGARNKAYGHPLTNHGLTAKYWSVFLGIEVTAEAVCFLNILQKISRSQNGVDLNRDSLVDIAGYSGNVEMILVMRKMLNDSKRHRKPNPSQKKNNPR